MLMREMCSHEQAGRSFLIWPQQSFAVRLFQRRREGLSLDSGGDVLQREDDSPYGNDGGSVTLVTTLRVQSNF